MGGILRLNFYIIIITLKYMITYSIKEVNELTSKNGGNDFLLPNWLLFYRAEG